MLEKADEVDDEACMLMRWAVSRIRQLEEKDMSEIVNKERGASWKAVAEEMQSARDALQADLNRANERIWELEAERNARAERDDTVRDLIKRLRERDERMRGLMLTCRNYAEDWCQYPLVDDIDAVLEEKI